MKLNIHLLLCSKRHYIDEIEYPPSPICGEKPQFESNVTYRPPPRLGVLAGIKTYQYKKYQKGFDKNLEWVGGPTYP